MELIKFMDWTMKLSLTLYYSWLFVNARKETVLNNRLTASFLAQIFANAKANVIMISCLFSFDLLKSQPLKKTLKNRLKYNILALKYLKYTKI